MRGVDHRNHACGHRQLLLEQQVVDLFDLGGDLADLGQAHHPAGLLERVEAAASRAQRFAVAGVAHQYGMLLADRGERMRSLDEIDVEERRIALGRIDVEKPLRFP